MNESVQTGLDLASFWNYYKNNRLGRLYFPNGNCVNSDVSDLAHFEHSKFYIDLAELGKMLDDCQNNHGEIVGVIAFGRSVRYPGVERVVVGQRRKYGIFGKMVNDEVVMPIQPSEADLLIVSYADAESENFLEPVLADINAKGILVSKGGIHLFVRGERKVFGEPGIDPIIDICITGNSVPIFLNQNFQNKLADIGIVLSSIKKAYWCDNYGKTLTGWIQ